MSYVVFAVEHADRLTLMGPPVVDGQPSLKQIALSFIETPKLARRNVSGDFGSEDPCAYEACELIRTAFIGKQVMYKEDFVIDALKRSAGRVHLATGDDATTMLLKAGYAIVPERIPPRMDKALFDQYTKLMSAAQASKKGLFGPGAARSVRKLVNLTPKEVADLSGKLKGTELLVRVERVLSGSGLIISAEQFGPTQITAQLTGITSRDPAAEPFIQKAKFHVERFLLNRNVKVRFDGVDAMGNMLISIVSPKGSFQEELLSNGLVKINNSTAGLSSRFAELQAAEETAKKGRRGMWHSLVVPGEESAAAAATGAATAAGAGETNGTTADGKVVKVTSGPVVELTGIHVMNQDGTPGPKYEGPVNFSGILVQAIHGDTVVVKEDGTGKYVRMTMAGVRTSKNITRDHDGNSPESRVTYNDYAWEAKEYIRTSFVGRAVRVQVEYARMIPETKEVRPAATVTVSDTDVNVAAALLEQGLGNFFLGKTDSCSMAPVLQAAEQVARDAQRGMHSAKDPLPMTVVELGRLGESRGRYYLSFLQRGMQGNRPPVLRGVVDMVLGPSSFRVYIPKEHFQISVKLAGVIAPNAAFNPNEKADAFSEEAKDFAVCRFQQREVNVQVYTSDRAGNFISSIILDDGTNASIALVEAGLATVSNADRLPFVQLLLDAEESARGAKKYIWSSNGNIPQRAAKMEAERAAANPHRLARVLDDTASFSPYMLTEVAEDGLSVYLQSYGGDVDSQKGRIQSLINRTVASGEYVPHKGELVVAQYREDKTWCRAKVVYMAKGAATVEVHFIDFGNTDEIRVKDVRAIPKGAEYALVRDTPPFAKLARLAYLKTKVPSDLYISTAVQTVYEYTDGEVLAKAEYKDGSGNPFFTVTVNENVASLSETLLQRGLALLDKRASTVDPGQFKRHEAAQEIARKGHKGMWQYGDVDDDEEDGY